MAASGRLTYLRIFADPSGESHMEELELAMLPKQIFPKLPHLHLSSVLTATGLSFCRVLPGMTEVTWHNSPSRKIVIWLTGDIEYETSDGMVRRLPPGSVVLSEDTTGKGHISCHPPEGQLLAFIDLGEDALQQ
jgi:hypothetical protein